jgi:hypothetical protein
MAFHSATVGSFSSAVEEDDEEHFLEDLGIGIQVRWITETDG